MPGPQLIDLGKPVADHPLNRGLVSWWLPLPNNRGGRTLFDLRRRANGALNNGPTWTAGRGDFSALTVDGTNQNVTFGALGSDPAAYTWAFRGYHRSGGDAIQGAFIRTDEAYGFFWVHSDSTLNGAAVHRNSAGTFFKAKTLASLSDNVWYEVGGTWDGATLTCYLNGIPQNTAAPTSILAGSASVLRFCENTQEFKGDFTDVALWTRCLSASEMAARYDQSCRGHPDTLRRVTSRVWGFMGASGGGGGGGSTAGNLLLLGVG